jgi:phosphatidylglycerol---prolipoprotein diacylglyceryl transferase
MRPTLFVWRGVRVPSYTTMLYLGLLAGAYSAYGAGRADGISGDGLMPAILALLVPAVLGARLAFVVGHWSVFRRQPGRVIAPKEGGAVAYGALVAIPLSLPLLMALGIPVASFWDAGAVGFLAAVVCLRVGCLLNGCCCGRRTGSWLGLSLPNAAGVRARRIPTPLLEAGWAAILLAGATVAVGRMPFQGALFLLLLAAYALVRFVLEFTREEPRNLGALTVAQAFSASFVVLAAGLFAVALWAG